MTKEEAIHEIEKVFEPAFANYIITALTEGATSSDKEQQFCEDCVSREEAIRIAEQGQIQGYEWQFKKLCNLPSVTPQRPKGKWILIHPLQEDDDGAYICSNCEHGDWDCNTNYKYCPFCGADMRESEDK